MAKQRGYSSRNKSEKILFVVLALVMIAVCIVMVSKVNKLESKKTVGAFSFEIGSLTSEGVEVKNTGSIRLKKAINADGLEIKLAEDANVKYKVFFYEVDEDGKEVFISASEELSADFDATTIPANAELCKVVITPVGDAEVDLLEVEGYAKQLTISYNK